MNIARRILERIHEVELDITPEFQKKDMGSWAGVSQELMNRIDAMVEEGHVEINGHGPKVDVVNVQPSRLANPTDDEKVIDELELWVDKNINHANTQMGGYNPIVTMTPFAGSTWTQFWEDVASVVVKMHVLTLSYGEADQRYETGDEARYDSTDSDTEGGPFSVVVNSPNASDVLTGTFDSVHMAEKVGQNWKTQMVSVSYNPEQAETEYSWTVVDVVSKEVSSG